jgi:YVTN family beta-propeller protein
MTIIALALIEQKESHLVFAKNRNEPEIGTTTKSIRNHSRNIVDGLDNGSSSSSSSSSSTKGKIPGLPAPCPDGSEVSKEKCICPDGSSPVNDECPKPTPPPGSLTFLSVVKKVINSKGGSDTKKPSDFTITVTGNNPSPSTFSGSSSGTSVTLKSGSYKVTETQGPSGYTASYSSDCSGSIDAGQNKQCTITNEAKKSPERKPLVTNIKGFSSPLGLAYDSAKKAIYVTNYGSIINSKNDALEGKVSVIDGSTNRAVDNTISVGKKPYAITYNPSNSEMYVANTFSNTISVIDTHNNNHNLISNIPVGNFPGNSTSGLAYDSDNGKIYVTILHSGEVSVIDSSTNKVEINIKGLKNPAGVAYNTDNGKIYVTNLEANSVSVINPLKNGIIATIPVGAAPSAIAYDSDNRKIYVANSGLVPSKGTISVIDPSSDKVIATIPVGIGPNGIAYNPDNGKIYVASTFSNDVYVIDASNNKVIATIPVDNHPYGVVYDPDNHDVYVANYDSDTISIIHQ